MSMSEIPGFESVGCESADEIKNQLVMAIKNATKILKDLQKLHRIPGVSIAVTVNGELAWTEGFGLIDLENSVPCTSDSVLKIASISKCITSALMAKEVDEGRLDLDVDLNRYIDWPELYYDNERVFIMPRMLACHLSGIRGYKYNPDLTAEPPDFRYDEYFITEKYPNVTSALQLFKNDKLISNPGDKYNYSNHGYTLLSAILEKTAKTEFKDMLAGLFSSLDMKNTCVNDPQNIVHNLARHYRKAGESIVNCPRTESSFKIAGAGLLSTTPDLIKFANYMISCHEAEEKAEGSLSKKVVRLLWTPMKNTFLTSNIDFQYGLGWQINHKRENGRIYVGHSGRTTGASSILMISLPLYQKRFEFPDTDSNFEPKSYQADGDVKVKSVAVAILTNMQGVSLNDVSINILDLFNKAFDDNFHLDLSYKQPKL